MKALQKGLAELHESGEFTDFTITCGPHSFAVHKAVICAQSAYFRSACGQNYAEGSKKSIDLKAIVPGEDDEKCDDPDAVTAMVRFFYYADYKAPGLPDLPALKPKRVRPEPVFSLERPKDISSDLYGRDSPSASPCVRKARSGRKSVSFDIQEPEIIFHVLPSSTDGNVVMHARVFAVAVKYQIPPLQRLAARKFLDAVKVSWSHHSFPEVARIVYTTTPEDFRDLRDIVVNTLHKHDSLLDSARIEALLSEVPALQFELLRLARGKSAVLD